MKRHGRSLRQLTTVVLPLATIVVSLMALPQMSSEGEVETAARVPEGERLPPLEGHRPGLRRTPLGYRIAPERRGSFTLTIPTRKADLDRAFLSLVAAEPIPGSTTATLVSSSGARRTIADAEAIEGAPQDVTDLVDGRPLRVRIETINGSGTSLRVFAGMTLTTSTDSASIDAPAALAGLWVALVVATVLLALGLLPRHWPLAPVAGIGLALLWGEVGGPASAPLPMEAQALWSMARDASWIGLDDGLLTGSSATSSPLAVQLYHAMTPLSGTGDNAARAAGALLGAIVVIAVYAVANRVAGRWPASIAALLVVVADPFRIGAGDASQAPALALAGVAFVLAVHLCLTRVSWPELAALTAAGLLIVLAEPLWLPGMFASAAFLALRCSMPGRRLRTAGVAVLLLAVVIAPNRIATADLHDGDPLGDVNAAAKWARFVELTTDRSEPFPDSSVANLKRRAATLERVAQKTRRLERRARTIEGVRAARLRRERAIERGRELRTRAESIRSARRASHEATETDIAERGPANRPTTLLQYTLTDRSLQTAVTGTLSGAWSAVQAFSERPESRLAGLVAFVPMLFGALYLVILPRLRMLVLLPLVVCSPTLLIVGEANADPFLAGLVIWPGMLIGAGAVVYAVNRLVRWRLSIRRGDWRAP